MSEGRILDIAHISFLDMIKLMITMSGAASAKGALIRNAISTAEKIKEVDYPTFDDFLQAIEDGTVEAKSSGKKGFRPRCENRGSIRS